jgi:pimeloyl-ACP methyl ester carboxylesterase
VKHYVIFIPGLGDHKAHGQDIGLNLWRLFGLHPVYLALDWENKESIDAKLKRLDALVMKLSSQNTRVSLVGVSAGASAVLNYYKDHPQIHRVILVCGKVNNPDNIQSKRYDMNPDFRESMYRIESSLDTLRESGRLSNILSIYSDKDTTVPPKDAYIEGANSKKIRAWSHPTVIMNTILFHGFAIARFINKSDQ